MKDQQVAIQKKRKGSHLDVVLNQPVEPFPSSFDQYRIPYTALPEINYSDVDTTCSFLGRHLHLPFMISSMTGGITKGQAINIQLAQAAETCKVAMALGSMRILLDRPDLATTFQIRKYCPSVPLVANLGLVQLNHGIGADEINKLLDLVEADAIFLHINPLQEAIQSEGDTNFEQLIPKLAKLINKINKPVLVKEVGTGLDLKTIKRLAEIGVKWFDVSGQGGTNWALVEGARRNDKLGSIFQEVGIPTDEALIAATQVKGINLIAGGGIRNGLHIFKALALGANLTTAARPVLLSAIKDTESAIKYIDQLKHELQIAMFVTGCKNFEKIKQIQLKKIILSNLL
ncbi:MAG: type 2 isopentenyl-diphosphate Delta-isomerase [bacterium]